MAENQVFSIAKDRPPRSGMTISTVSRIRAKADIVYFSLGAGTDISAETYPTPKFYIGAAGRTVFELGGRENGKQMAVQAGENFRFAKGGLHSVTANGRFKMALLLTLK